MNTIKDIIRTAKKVNWKSVGIKALKTFIQAFVASIYINDFLTATDIRSLKAVAISTATAGAAAGLSAVWNMCVEYFNATVLETETEESAD